MVLPDCPWKKNWVLGNDRKKRTEPVKRNSFNVHIVDGDPSLANIDNTEEAQSEGRFAAPSSPTYANLLTWE